MVRRLMTGTEAALPAVPMVDRARAAPTTTLSEPARLQRLRERRSAAYLQAVAQLDAGTHVHDRQAMEALKATLEQELGQLLDSEQLHGIVARCHLGHPYEVHTLQVGGSIIEHFKLGQSLPLMLERARTLAVHPAYAFIEVYANRLVAVMPSGQTAIIEGAT